MKYHKTTAEGIYVGDVIQEPKFTHTATYERLIAARNILEGNQFKLNLSKNTWVLFPDPEIASAGLRNMPCWRFSIVFHGAL